MARFALIAPILIAGLALPSVAVADEKPARFVSMGEVADAPVGFIELCDRSPEACGAVPGQVRRSGSATCAASSRAESSDTTISHCRQPSSSVGIEAELGYTGATAQRTPWLPHLRRSQLSGEAALVRKVQRRVNRSVLQVTDTALYGRAEFWRAAGSGRDAAGDCEDIALQKRDELIAEGFPRDRLFLAVVYDSKVGLHTILLARLADGDVMLDSLSSRVKPWHDSPYRYLRLQVPGDPMTWRRPA